MLSSEVRLLLLLGCGLLGWCLCSLLGSSFLGLSGGLLDLLCLWLLGLWLLLSLGLLGELEGSSSLLTGGGGSHDGLGGDQLLEGEPDTSGSLGSINLVVGTDVLQDGLAGGALLVSQGLDGGLDHGGVGRVGSGGLGLGSSLLDFGGSSGGHVDCCCVDVVNLPC